jgi:hypothetical protein
METVCQACGYQREPTDQAPDWECPSCGKAYAKTSHNSHGSFSGYAQIAPSESGSLLDVESGYQQKSGTSADKGTGGTKLWVWGAWGVALGILFIWGIPILSNPSSAAAVLLHGDIGFVGLFFLAVAGAAVYLNRLSAKVDVNSPRSKFVFLVKYLALLFTVMFVVLAVWLGNQEHTEVKIQRNGQRAMAEVVSIYTGSCGKRSCSVNVKYAFMPTSEAIGASQPVYGYADLTTSDHPNDPALVYARTNHRVPIAYEVGHPQVSALNFNDNIFSLDHGKRYRSKFALLGGIFLGVFLLALVVGSLSLWLKT